MNTQKGLLAIAYGRQLQAGQTLLELLLAFSASIMVLSAIVIAVVTSLSNTQYTKNQNLATSYAQEAMAVVRQMRYSSWTNFSSKNQVNYCLNQNSVVLINNLSCILNVGIYSRSVTIVHNSADCSSNGINGSKVTIQVSWSDTKCQAGNPNCHTVELISCFSKADPTPTP